jgi:hypothetical protein
MTTHLLNHCLIYSLAVLQAHQSTGISSHISTNSTVYTTIIMYFSTALLVASSIAFVHAGVNCNGSGNCPGIAGSLSDIVNISQGLDENRIYRPGEHIICIESKLKNGLCAFLQGNSAENGHFVQNLTEGLAKPRM